MSDQLSELDALIESDVLEALGEEIPQENITDEVDSVLIEDLDEISEPVIDDTETNDVLENETIEVTESPKCDEQEAATQTMASGDLATLLSQLLNNKTIEITIKIKD